MQILIEMNLLEHGVRIPISECTSSYLAIASAAVMGQYILFVTKMATAHSWATMAAFDKKHRESLAQAQGGSLDPNVLIHSFLLEECTNGGLYNGKRPKVNDDAPYRTATCRKFNTKNGCSHPNCRFIHKCSKCGKSHAVSDCTDWTRTAIVNKRLTAIVYLNNSIPHCLHLAHIVTRTSYCLTSINTYVVIASS